MSGQVNYLVEAPELGQECYVLCIQQNSFYVLCKWEGDTFEKRWLALHRVYPTEEDVVRAIEFVKDFYKSHKEQLNYLTSEPMPGTRVSYGMTMTMTMNGSPFDILSINFDPKNTFHQDLLMTFQLYGTREDVIKAANLITEALEEEYKKAH